MAKSKCVMCKNSFQTEEMVVILSKKYCTICSKIKEEEILNKPPKEKTDYNILVDMICEIYGIKLPTGMMFQQLKNYRSDGYNFTDIGMYYTLKYYYKTLGNTVKEDTALGIIPYFYDKAKWHFSKVFDMQDLADNTTLDEKTVYIYTKQVNKIIKKGIPLSLEIVRKEVDDDNEDID